MASTLAGVEWHLKRSKTARVIAVSFTPPRVSGPIPVCRTPRETIATFRLQTLRFAGLHSSVCLSSNLRKRAVAIIAVCGCVRDPFVNVPHSLNGWHFGTGTTRKEDAVHGQLHQRFERRHGWRRRRWRTAKRAQLFKEVGKECAARAVKGGTLRRVGILKPTHSSVLKRKTVACARRTARVWWRCRGASLSACDVQVGLQKGSS